MCGYAKSRTGSWGWASVGMNVGVGEYDPEAFDIDEVNRSLRARKEAQQSRIKNIKAAKRKAAPRKKETVQKRAVKNKKGGGKKR